MNIWSYNTYKAKKRLYKEGEEGGPFEDKSIHTSEFFLMWGNRKRCFYQCYTENFTNDSSINDQVHEQKVRLRYLRSMHLVPYRV